MLTYIKECQAISKRILLDEQADGVGWLALKPAVLHVEYLVEEATYMETETIFLLL